MKPIQVAPGTKYGDLSVIKEVESEGKRKFLCKCSCGKVASVRLDHLRSGHTSSCGECGIECGGKRMTIVQWAEANGINESTLRARLKKMDIKEALLRRG